MTRVRTPNTEDAAVMLEECSESDALESAGVLFESALAFARTYLRLDEIELRDLIELTRFLDEHAVGLHNVETAAEEVRKALDATDAEIVPNAPASHERKIFMQIPIQSKDECDDPSCVIHRGNPTQEDMRKVALAAFTARGFRVEGAPAKLVEKLVRAPTTRFRVDGKYMYVIADAPKDGSDDPDDNGNSNLN